MAATDVLPQPEAQPDADVLHCLLDEWRRAPGLPAVLRESEVMRRAILYYVMHKERHDRIRREDAWAAMHEFLRLTSLD